MSQTICVIPARGTSPGLPKKNFKIIGGKPMVVHTIETALACDPIDEVFVSTESSELASIAREYGARTIARPERLTSQIVLLDTVLNHALSELEAGSPDVNITDRSPVIMLQPNVPFRREADLRKALGHYDEMSGRAVISVTEEKGFFWKRDDGELVQQFEERAPATELDPYFRETGSIYVTNKELLERGNHVGENPKYLVTDRFSSFSVNSILDFWMAEKLYQGPNIVFRVDGGGEIGMGHIYRCLTIAKELDNRFDCNITFLTLKEYPAGVEKIRSNGFNADVVEQRNELQSLRNHSPDIIFSDVLNTDPKYVRQLRQFAAAVINLEDMDGGLEHADFVVNALYHEEETANHFYGPDYVVLREEFLDREVRVPERAENVLMTFGGSDPLGLSVKAVKALAKCDIDLSPVLVLGPDFGHAEDLYRLPDEVLETVEIRQNVTDMGELMQEADIAVASGGRTVFELLVTGTPAIVIAQNEREANRLERLTSQEPIIDYLGDGKHVTEETILEHVTELSGDRDRRRRMIDRGQRFVDGKGIQRILDIVYEAFVG